MKLQQPTEVCVDDAGIAVCAASLDALPQARRPDGIALHRPDIDAGGEQRKRQRTRAGAEIDDEFAGAQVERTNEPFDDVSINEKVLTEFPTPRVALGWESPGHGPSP